jgi:thiamine biosynthesis lipoprotein
VEGRAFGAGWSVTWAPVEGVVAADVERVAVEVLEALDRELSTWRADSEIEAVRAGPGAVGVSGETAHVIGLALALAERSGGAFDPTVQPLMELWGLHGTPRTTWPTDAEVDAARARVGASRVRVAFDAAGGATVDAGGTALDVSAIAPGFAADRLWHELASLGLADLYVDVGGEVRVQGESGRGGPWRIGIERPEVGAAPGASLVATVALTGGAVATSGNYRTRVEVEGRVVHHTMDPRTGRPSTADVLSATVIAPTAAEADGWATALMVIGEPGLALVDAQPGHDAWILVPGPTGEPVARGTPGVERFVTPVGAGGLRD